MKDANCRKAVWSQHPTTLFVATPTVEVGKKLFEPLRWLTELTQAAIELIAIKVRLENKKFTTSSRRVHEDAIADNLFDRYVKRKKLEPLETYVPAVILTQLQFKDIEKSLEVDQPQYAAYRSALRSGPSASFRSNIRAVAQYASDGGNGKTASDDVERCLSALDELDSLFLRASRNNPAASAKLMKEKIGVAVNALDSLLQTVPSDVLDKGKAIAEAYRAPDTEMVPQELDRELTDLQSIL
ncbi:hypothetical protein KSS87_013144 [Heliosperma pusillum]|nr:hypothetical protein KSS87_013144 [Heliosperma pusillum]